MMTLSESRHEIDRLLAEYARENVNRDELRSKTCRIVAPGCGHSASSGGGRVIRSPREYYELSVG